MTAREFFIQAVLIMLRGIQEDPLDFLAIGAFAAVLIWTLT